MRISNSMPGTGDSGGSLADMPLNAKTIVPGQKTFTGGPIQFGPSSPAVLKKSSQLDPAANDDTLISILKQLLKLVNPEQSDSDGMDLPAQADPVKVKSDPVDQTQGVKKADDVKNPDSPLASKDQPDGADADFLDNSKYSSPQELKKYDAQVASLPPEQREQAAKELNRPIAAARMAAEGGEGADQAKAFIDANPTLKTAVDTAAHGGKPDGTLSENDYKAFAVKMDKAADSASKDVEDYQKKNPGADPQSLALVRSAATLRANEPLAKAGALNKDGKVDRYITGDALKGLQSGNPGLSPLLAQTAKTFSQPGLLNMLDQGGFEGESLSQHNPDQAISTHNIDDWIKKQAPTNGGEFSSTISDAATRNAVANVDISKLNEDVFKNPEKYSGEQKAAVLIKLQDTQAQVDGGSKLRNVDKTSEALQQKIGQLQADPDVKKYLDTALPKQQKAIIESDPNINKAVNQRHDEVRSGKTLQDDMQAAKDKAAKENEGKKPEDQVPVDYSQALGNLDAELQLQRDLGGKDVPTSAEVLAKRPDLKKDVESSYQESFVQGKAVENGLQKDKKSDAHDVLALVDSKKLAYDSALGDSVTTAAQSGYAEATIKALTTTKKGMDVINDLKEAGTLPKEADVKKLSGTELYSQLRDNVEKDSSKAGLDFRGKVGSAGGGVFGVSSLLSIHDNLKAGDKTAAAKNIIDGIKGSAEIGKLGYNAVAKTLGKDASAGLGRVAGAVAGRVVGAVAGEAAGFAAASAIGAAAGPVGWIIDAALALGFGIKAIVDAVNKQHKQDTFDHNVDPTLEQFGIPKAH
ncbi:type III effector HrpK domain-containing protein [Pseudomonas sp. GL-B-16]|uniref:type III effector HrpK domain-containing protein n=1 Tax=Pseudomonas sp. GL-B-16 TaxID=2832373 RepID=UPI001CC0FFC8|nr:type III effector HrpK domain-containing protein [Pseudomonas sp. GL-B-16]